MNEVSGVVERIVYQADDGYCVAAVRDQRGRMHTIVGTLPNLSEGAQVCCKGEWVRHEKYGRQFKVESLDIELPFTESGIISYLTALGVKGLGVKTAEKIVSEFGVDVFEVLDHTPEKLDALVKRGVSSKVIDGLRTVWRDSQRLQKAVAFFQSHGIGLKTAIRILKESPNAAAIVKDNPYYLTTLKTARVGFRTADKMARHLGWSKTDPNRIQAGVIHVLQEHLNSGHTLLPVRRLAEMAVNTLGVPKDKVMAVLRRMLDEALLHPVEHEHAGEPCVTLPMIHGTEKQIVTRLLALRQGVNPKLSGLSDEALARRIDESERAAGIRLADEQRAAVKMALREKCLVITGGPGVGKTTITNVILSVMRAVGEQRKRGVDFALCAPTGKAAKRMSEATGYEAKTIHRLLEFNGDTCRFSRNRENPLEADVVIVDESSMIDIFLAKDLLAAVPDTATLILLGDKDQLPSVGPGQVLGDVIRSGAVPTVHLHTVHRQSAKSGIVRTAHRINRHLLPEKTSVGKDFRFFKTRSTEETYETVQVLVQAMLRLLEKAGLPQEVQVLAPMRRGMVGTDALNEAVRDILNPNPRKNVVLKRSDRTTIRFAEGDRVIQTVNSYSKEVFNGTVGTISRIANDHAFVCFEGRDVKYTYEEMRAMLDLAYAISIHKSQGSEYPGVIIPVDASQTFMLNKKLLYTGITRAKHFCFMAGDPKTLAIAIKKRVNDNRLTSMPILFEEARARRSPQNTQDTRRIQAFRSRPFSL